ncbi:SAICAR synthase-like protein [Whalleya microplaca]|nr:SAICAR synthase-like protein [Whalleya microplaca]
MARREVLIARSIVYAILTANDEGKSSRKPSWWARALRFFRLYWLTFHLPPPGLFVALRRLWNIKEEDYRSSFGGGMRRDSKKGGDTLLPMGDMGYSGSTFFRTSDGAYLVKSIPRRFEHEFFRDELIFPYADHMHANPSSLLVHITDFLESTHKSIGSLLGLAPSHHIVMENILYGQDQEPEDGTPRLKWESWDLKPTSYFYPERDVAGGALASQATKSKLADEFYDKIRLSKEQAAEFKQQLEQDTMLLADCNAVDYSLFLVRVSTTHTPEAEESRQLIQLEEDDNDPPTHPAQPPFSPPSPPSWHTGITSSDGKEVYRAAVLDFFWAKHSVHAKAMTGLVRGYNLIDEQGPMSITTESKEYRDRFLNMCTELLEVQE